MKYAGARVGRKDQTVKRIVIPAILIAVLMGGAGCMQSKSGQNINDLALAYMEQKYGEKFEYTAPWGNSMDGTREFLVSCKSLPGQDIVVQVENFKKENKVFSDNYIAVKYHDETIDFLEKCADEEFGETKVTYRVAKSALSPELSAQASFDDFLSDKKSFISASIYIRESSFKEKEQVNKIADKISSKCSAEHLGILFTIITDSEYENLEEIMQDKDTSRKAVCLARLTRQDGEQRFEWIGEE